MKFLEIRYYLDTWHIINLFTSTVTERDMESDYVFFRALPICNNVGLKMGNGVTPGLNGPISGVLRTPEVYSL
jgi:hypothetical protein